MLLLGPERYRGWRKFHHAVAGIRGGSAVISPAGATPWRMEARRRGHPCTHGDTKSRPHPSGASNIASSWAQGVFETKENGGHSPGSGASGARLKGSKAAIG